MSHIPHYRKKEVNRKEMTLEQKSKNDTYNNEDYEQNLIFSQEELSDIFEWVDLVPLSRPKKNINRDFSDGVLFAELLAAYFPKLVDMHNYVAASSLAQKKNNWEVLNKKVLFKIGMKFTSEEILELAQAKIGAIEIALKHIRIIVINYLAEKEKKKMAFQLAAARGDGNDNSNNRNSPREAICIVNGNSDYDSITYNGIKMVPIQLLEEKDKRIQSLEKKLNELGSKVRRQETLLGLKETHLQDLTFQLHELHIKMDNEKKMSPGSGIRKWIDPTGLL